MASQGTPVTGKIIVTDRNGVRLTTRNFSETTENEALRTRSSIQREELEKFGDVYMFTHWDQGGPCSDLP